VPANGVSFTEVRDRNPKGENCDGHVRHSKTDVRKPEASAQSLAKCSSFQVTSDGVVPQ